MLEPKGARRCHKKFVLLRAREIADIHKLDVYEKHGGYAALKKALGMSQDAVIDEVKKANLRGRGGAAIQPA